MSRKPSKKTTPSKKPLPQAIEMVKELLKQVRSYTMSSNCQCTGQCTVERPKDTPTVIMYASFANGDYLTWFNDKGKLTLFALVNEKMRHLMSAPATEDGVKRIMAKAKELQAKLGRSGT